MSFNLEKYKIDKLTNKIEDITNFLNKNSNNNILLKNAKSQFVNSTILYDSNWMPFTSYDLGWETASKGFLSLAVDYSFLNTIKINDTMLPYVTYNLLIKKPQTNISTVGIVSKIITSHDYLTTQTGLFKYHVAIYRQTLSGLVFLGYTEQFGDTILSGASDFVVLTTNYNGIINSQRYNDFSSQEILNWTKKPGEDGVFEFNTSGTIYLEAETLKERLQSAKIGDREYTATYNPEHTQILYYIQDDKRTNENRIYYSVIPIDIELRLLIAITKQNLISPEINLSNE